MVARQLRPRGIDDPRVLQAMSNVPRELFVPERLQSSAYDDGALPIDEGQTISQPYTVAFMCQAAQLKPADRVLEIGTGSGYGAAVLSQIVHRVDTIERLPDLAKTAHARLTRLGYKNVAVHVGDGTRGWPAAAPYDAIIVTAGGTQLPSAYVEQLSEGGRVIIPLGSTPRNQAMKRYTRQGKQLNEENLGRFAFVPLVGEYGWEE